MGKTTQKSYTQEFKARVAIEALTEQSTPAELTKKYEGLEAPSELAA